MLSVSRASLWLAGTVTLLAATACSGPTINSFSVTAGPPSLTISPGGTATIGVAATTTNKSPITATIIIYNLPAGVSYSPASPTVTTGSETTITLTAAPNTPAITNNVQISGYAGLAGSSASVSLTVTPAQ